MGVDIFLVLSGAGYRLPMAVLALLLVLGASKLIAMTSYWLEVPFLR